MTNSYQIPNEFVSLFKALPKKCSCAMCVETKDGLKSALGLKDYNKACKSLSIMP
jgi:hypothetical protein